jgi:hypothetical protein
MTGLRDDVAKFVISIIRLRRQPSAPAWLAFALTLSLGASLVVRANAGTPLPQQGGRLTIEQLGDALTSLGKNTTNNNGQVYYSVNCDHGQWKGTVIVSLSPNGNFIWMTIDPVGMPDPGSTSTAALLSLLKKNTDIGPMFFSISGRRLRLSYPVPNHDMNAGMVKSYFQALVDTAVDTMPLWNAGTLARSSAGAETDTR